MLFSDTQSTFCQGESKESMFNFINREEMTSLYWHERDDSSDTTLAGHLEKSESEANRYNRDHSFISLLKFLLLCGLVCCLWARCQIYIKKTYVAVFGKNKKNNPEALENFGREVTIPE